MNVSAILVPSRNVLPYGFYLRNESPVLVDTLFYFLCIRTALTVILLCCVAIFFALAKKLKEK